MAAIARANHPETEVCYIVPMGFRKFFKLLFKHDDITAGLSDNSLESIGRHFSKSDMVCLSSMTPFADVTKKIIRAIRSANSKIYIVWGGVHPIINPEDAIQFADAICVGEGETAFQTFLSDYEKKRDYTGTKNFWFNADGKIIRNGFLPLHTQEEMEKFPPPLYAERELIYSEAKGFVTLGLSEYLSFNDLVYNTVWSIGCPNRCTYCANSKFIENDKNYRKLRYPSVDYIIAEIKGVIAKHPHISTIRFHDDNFMAIPFVILQEFAEKWRNEIGKPFWVYGLIPIFVKRDKMAILVSAGMNRIRMGIQSGSDRILEFYKRPNRPGVITSKMNIISDFSKFMISPFYDIIVDNPIETRKDILETLNLMYNAPRPYCIFVYSLRIIPNTEMAKDFERLGIHAKGIGQGYKQTKPTIANAMIYMLSIFRPAKCLFSLWLERIDPYKEDSQNTILFPIFRTLYKFKIVYDQIKSLDFSPFPGRTGWLIWKLGIVGCIQQKRMKKAKNAIGQI
ncbi:MAG: radical SAM protein [Deltaproteobacteria bacterium]|nr:radical SAM protein [Deltaproteobacteria bacterium]